MLPDKNEGEEDQRKQSSDWTGRDSATGNLRSQTDSWGPGAKDRLDERERARSRDYHRAGSFHREEPSAFPVTLCICTQPQFFLSISFFK